MYQSDFELGYVALNVRNLDLQSQYYQQVLGLSVIHQDESMIDLGVGKTVLVRLIKTEETLDVAGSYGLYHLAILLPSREALAQIFKHFVDHSVPLIGASDHDYSEAIYLEDTEGNGIEIYRDRPVSEWDIKEDGRIIGTTEAMDAEGLYRLATPLGGSYKMPEGSRMGHVHLSVRKSDISSGFYQNVLKVQDKFSVRSASWLASGNYHHHLAVNEWGGQSLSTRTEGMRGLAYYTVIFEEEQLYQDTIERAKKFAKNVEIGEHEASFTDLDGIKTKLVLKQ
ncbi:VOC family protein [uncultured Granulicatella sp.]|uniref:VOC family protein n=1 Tax=uncultured Granulicatella sp. TaxID=316089 RepID=UPI0028DBB301|nr:VOC family protein [uncultured Granulicatella sp.]